MKIIRLCLVLLLGSSCTCTRNTYYGDASEPPVPQLQSSAVFLSRDGKSSFCGGTTLPGNKVLTAAHCILDDEGKPEKKLYVLVGTNAYSASILRYNQKVDLALLRTAALMSKSASHLAFNQVPLGSSVWSLSSPASIRNLLVHGTLSHPDKVVKGKNHFAVYQLISYFGSSGGGIFDQSGRLVGVISRIMTNVLGSPIGFTYSPTYDQVKDFLTRHEFGQKIYLEFKVSN